jgi:hypothetical protein
MFGRCGKMNTDTTQLERFNLVGVTIRLSLFPDLFF